MFWIFIIMACVQFHVSHISALLFPQYVKLPLPPGAIGPHSYSVDARGSLHTGVADGRILKFQPTNATFTEFATISAFRTQRSCNRPNLPNLGPICSRPLGIQFYYQTGQLHIAGGTSGLLVVGPNGGPASLIATNVDGALLNSVEALDIDQSTGVVYFTDAGSIFRQTSNISRILSSGDTSGKLLKYDPRTKQITQLLSGLSGPTGVALSSTGSYILITESIPKRIQRFWLTGPRSNTLEIFKNLEGFPYSIRRTLLGNFWVAMNVMMEPPRVVTLAQRFGELGAIAVFSVNIPTELNNTSIITQVYEYLGSLYIGSLDQNFVGRYIF